jgi:hypothetical protein
MRALALAVGRTEDVLALAVGRMEDVLARARAGRTCRALRAAARARGGVAACMRAGSRAVEREIEAFVAEYRAGLAARCIAAACASVAVFGVEDADLAEWGAYGHRWHLVTLVVAAAVNVPRWRDALVAAGREAHRAEVYCAVLREADARSAAWARRAEKLGPRVS